LLNGNLFSFGFSSWQVLKFKIFLKFVCLVLVLVDSKNIDICLNILFSFLKKSQIWLNCHLQEHIIPQQQLWCTNKVTTLETVPNELKLLQKFDAVKNILLTKKDNPKEDPEVLFPFFFFCAFWCNNMSYDYERECKFYLFTYLFIGTNGQIQGGALFNITKVEKEI
jgi:hypothetical protein